MRSFLLAVVFAALASEPAHAQTVVASCAATVFTAVDAVETGGTYVVVTGIVQGESAPSKCMVSAAYRSTNSQDLASQCQSLALIAMTNPGRYLLEVTGSGDSRCPSCKLTKVKVSRGSPG